MATKILDMYRQFAVLSHWAADAGGAAYNALTQLVTGLSNLQKIAWAVSRIEYLIPAAVWDDLLTVGDYIAVEITASNNLAQPFGTPNPSCYDFVRFDAAATAAAGSTFPQPVALPHIHDFGENDLLVLPQNLYLHVQRFDANVLGAYIYARIYYKEIELGPENWYDLLQMRLPLGT